MDINGQSLDAVSDPAITANVNKSVGQTNQGIASSYGSGAGEARGLLNSGNFNQGLSYGDSATSSAIKSRYMTSYGLGEKQLSLENIKNAQTDHLRNLNVATQAAGQEVEMNKQKALIKWQIEQQNKKARGAVLGTVLGITGAVVGGVVAGAGSLGVGAVGGAAAGYAAGNAAGNAIGGS